MLTIGIFGKINSGKSSLTNSLANENISIVSDVRGTTSDNVIKMIEVGGVGKVRLVDTAGFDDDSPLANERLKSVQKTIDISDLVVLVAKDELTEQDKIWLKNCKQKGKKVFVVLNISQCENVEFAENFVKMNVQNANQVALFVKKIVELFAKEKNSIVGNLVSSGDTVILVMPQDDGAPEGRLILPQSMVIRQLLDENVVSINSTPANFNNVFERFGKQTKLVITDSSVFAMVKNIVGDSIKITSFSILFAKAKGDINVFVQGANALDSLQNGDKILIMEACSHTSSHKDIGGVVIPNAIKKYCGKDVSFHFIHGKDEPQDYSQYKLVVHCGGCVQSRAFMQSRIKKCLENGVAITNYGVILAKINDVLASVVY